MIFQRPFRLHESFASTEKLWVLFSCGLRKSLQTTHTGLNSNRLNHHFKCLQVPCISTENVSRQHNPIEKICSGYSFITGLSKYHLHGLKKRQVFKDEVKLYNKLVLKM